MFRIPGRFAFAFLVCEAVSLSMWAQLPLSYSARTIAGSDYAGDGGAATAALIAHIEGVALDARGNLYIADSDNHRVRRVSPGGTITTVAGTGHAGFSGDGGAAAAAQLNTPYGIAVDSAGNLYIADLGNARVRRVAADGSISTIAGGGTVGGAQSDGHLATEIALKAPRNVVVDYYGQIYLSDFADHRVYQIGGRGVISRLAGTGAAGFGGDGGPALKAQLSSPAGLAVDSWGAVYVADTGNARVRKIYRGVISTLGDSGNGTTLIALRLPTGLAIDGSNNLFIADSGNSQVLRVTPLLQVSTVQQPARDLAVDAIGTLYLANGSSVRRLSVTDALLTVAGGLSFGFWGDGGLAVNAVLNAPAGVAQDASGNLYVADTGNHRIRRVTPDGHIGTIAGTGQAGFSGDGTNAITANLNSPQAIAADAIGNLYVADTGNNRIRKIDATGRIATIAGTGDSGYSGDRGNALLARLNAPSGLALDGSGNLYIADTGNDTIRKLDTDSVITTIAGNGRRGLAGDGGAPVAASLNAPHAIAIDPSGVLFIGDTGNRRVRKVTPGDIFGPSTIVTFPDSPQAGWQSPQALAVDADGNLFLADSAGQRVYRIEPNGRITTLAGDGFSGFNGDIGPGLTTRLMVPSALSVDALGNVYVADTGNNRVRQLSPDVQAVIADPVTAALTIVNAASLQPGPVAPGEFVSIFGQGFLSGDGANAGATQVLFNDQPATLSYTGTTQINAEAPYSIAGSKTVNVKVLAGGVTRGAATAGVADAVPALFTIGTGAGQAAALNEDGSVNSVSSPASRGSVIVLFATGEGARNADANSTPVLPVSLTIGNYAAQLQYVGMTPGFPGLLQINAEIPGGYAPAGVLPVVLQVGTAVSQPGVTIAVQ